MNEQTPQRDEFNWWLPIYAVGGGSVLLLLLFVPSVDADLLYIFVVGPIACVVWLILLIESATRKELRRSLSMLLTLMLFLLLSAALLKNEAAFRPALRWLLFSRQFKTQVLAQPVPANEELKHVEWDGWGGAPVGDWTAYVVFDPRILFRQRRRTIHPACSEAFHATSMSFVVSKAIGILSRCP